MAKKLHYPRYQRISKQRLKDMPVYAVRDQLWHNFIQHRPRMTTATYYNNQADCFNLHNKTHEIGESIKHLPRTYKNFLIKAQQIQTEIDLVNQEIFLLIIKN